MAKKTKMLSLRIEPATIEFYRAMAKREERTLSFVIARALANYARRQRTKG